MTKGKPRGRRGGRKPLPPGVKKITVAVRLAPADAARFKALGASGIVRMMETTPESVAAVVGPPRPVSGHAGRFLSDDVSDLMGGTVKPPPKAPRKTKSRKMRTGRMPASKGNLTEIPRAWAALPDQLPTSRERTKALKTQWKAVAESTAAAKPAGYRVVPSTGGITREEAIAYAVEEWPDDRECIGIEWKGVGGRHTMSWKEVKNS